MFRRLYSRIETRLVERGHSDIFAPRMLVLLLLSVPTLIMSLGYLGVNLTAGRPIIAIQNITLALTLTGIVVLLWRGRVVLAVSLGLLPAMAVYTLFLSIISFTEPGNDAFLLLVIIVIVLNVHLVALFVLNHRQFAVGLAINVVGLVVLGFGHAQWMRRYPIEASGVAVVTVLAFALAFGSRLTTERAAREVNYRRRLNREIHHRLKNEANILLGIIDDEIESAGSDAVRQALLRERERIVAVLSLHGHLYQHDDVSAISLGAYLRDIVTPYRGRLATRGSDVRFVIEHSGIMVRANDAMQIGLIVNELTVNSLRHAFPENRGEVRIVLAAGEPGLAITYVDNGSGADGDSVSSGFGSDFVDAVVASMNGRFVRSFDGGYTAEIVLPSVTIVQGSERRAGERVLVVEEGE